MPDSEKQPMFFSISTLLTRNLHDVFGENVVDTFESLRTNEDDSIEDKIKALAEIICRAGKHPTAALFVLMGTLENSMEPETFANTAKHVAFTRCAELNLYGMVDAQIVMVEGELLGSNSAHPDGF